MPGVSFCPIGEQLNQFARGTLDEVSAERVIHHLSQCRACRAALESVPIADTPMAALQKWADATGGCDRAEVKALIQRLMELKAESMSDAESTAANLPAAGAARSSFLSPPQAAGELGRLGGYRILKILGAGGMGMVYEAEDVRLKRKAALKVMKPELAANPGVRQRFLREAESCAAVRSDHVVTIYQVGEQDDTPFLAMEYLEGLSLADWLGKSRKPSLVQAARIGRQIALGLADAHACGLIHRDIKPANIWLDSRQQGRVKLLDFGLARGDKEEVQLTQSGAILGTPAYMAPEQARGQKVDPRCDLFSLGVVLYRLTTGQMPFRGTNTMALLTALALDTPTPPRTLNAAISPRMASLIEALLRKDREQRPASAKAVAKELAAIEREASQPAGEERTEPIPVARLSEQPAQIDPLFDFSDLSGGRKPPERNVGRLTPPAERLGKLLSGSRLRWLVVASLLLLGGATAAIVVIIRDKEGKEVARFDVPKGGKVELVDDNKEKAGKNERPKAKRGVRIEPEPLAPMAANQPLSGFALVGQPVKLPGVRSWSIVARETGIPSNVAYRPDGKHLAVGAWDGAVHIWHATNGRLIRVILPEGTVVSQAWSPDGRVLAVGTGVFDRPVQLWDADTGRLLRALETPTPDFIFALAWSPDGRKVRAWGTSGRCCTWDVEVGRRLHEPSIACQCERPAFSPDGLRLAGTIDGNRVVIWDANTGKEVSRWNAPTAVLRLAWSPDGKRLACTGQDGLRIWDVDTRKQVLHYPKPISPNDPPAWSPDGRTLAISLDKNEGAELIDAAKVGEPRRLAEGGNAWMAWSPDGTAIARINGEPWVRVYDAATGERLLALTDGRALRGFVWSPSEQTLAVSDRFDTFLVSSNTGQVLGELKQATWPVEWSPDGKLLCSQGPDNTVQLWHANGKFHLTLADYKAEITSLSWSPDGKRLATTAQGEKSVRLWDVAKGQRDRELGPFAGAAQNVKWSADGRLLTFNVSEVGWHIWDLEKGRLLNDPAKWKISWLDLTPDGRSVLTAPSEKEAYRLRDLTNGSEGARLPYGHGLFQAHPLWSPDGRLLAASCGDGIELWSADLNKRLRTLILPGGASKIAFSRDGKRVAALSSERLFVWETDTGRQRGVLVLGRRNNALTVAPNGDYTGNENVGSGIVMLVEKDDGTQEMLEPAEFQRKYRWKNDPKRVRLIAD